MEMRMATSRVFDTEKTSGAAKQQDDLPRWQLNDLFTAMDDPAIAASLDQAKTDAAALEQEFKDKLAAASGADLARMIQTYEAIEERIGKVLSYAQLLHAADRDSAEIGKFYQSMQERSTAIGQHLLFVTLELNKISDERLAEQTGGSADLARFTPWLKRVRSFRPHQLDDAAEKMLYEKSVVGRSAWVRLFDQTMAGLRFDIQDERMTIQQALNLLSSKDRGKREEAGKALAKGLEDEVKTFALITNTLAKDKQIEDGWRHFARPISSRNLANHVEDEVVDALIQSVRNAYPKLSHRYYALKARWMGFDKLEYWDRNAPLPEDHDTYRSFNDAKFIVLDAYRRFEPSLADIVAQFFDRMWIDAEVRPGKDGGAFCHPTVPSAHPYVLMNYQGRNRDVMTLAHELGHAVHQTLAAKQGLLMASTPLTLAETASVFGEQLTFQSLLQSESDPAKRRVLLASKIEDMLNTVVRQIAFVEFERMVHDQRREAELTPEQLGEIWLQVAKDSLGDAFIYRDEFSLFWSYVPHFIHVPFYVYAYAFGDCLVNSLFSVYQKEPAGFTERYLSMLEAGGTLHHRELLKPFGLDAADPNFWDQGLGLLAGMIDQLEQDLGDQA